MGAREALLLDVQKVLNRGAASLSRSDYEELLEEVIDEVDVRQDALDTDDQSES